MKIQKIISQYRRDFYADYVCECCGYVDKNKEGYDDAYFHNEVIPSFKCPKCGKKSSDSNEEYRPLTTKYAEGFQI